MNQLDSQVRRSLVLIGQLDSRAEASIRNLDNKLRVLQTSGNNISETDKRALVNDISKFANDARILRLNTLSEAKYMHESVNDYYNRIQTELDQLTRTRDEVNNKKKSERLKGIKRKFGNKWTRKRRILNKEDQTDNEERVEGRERVLLESIKKRALSRSRDEDASRQGRKPVSVFRVATTEKKLPAQTQIPKKKPGPKPKEPRYCLCNDIYYGEMVACDNRKCTIEWYHLPCVNLKKPPKGKWFCPNCR